MNHSENEQIYHPNFVWYVERSSSGDINPMSYHLTLIYMGYFDNLFYMGGKKAPQANSSI